MKILYLDPDLNNLLDIAYNPGIHCCSVCAVLFKFDVPLVAIFILHQWQSSHAR